MTTDESFSFVVCIEQQKNNNDGMQHHCDDYDRRIEMIKDYIFALVKDYNEE